MKILLISGGSRVGGATERAVEEAAEVLKRGGAEYSVFHLNSAKVAPCNGCGACRRGGNCTVDDASAELISAAVGCDGFIFFTPVHYGGASGGLKSAMGRLFYSSKSHLEYKPAAAVAVSRRGGNVSAIEELNRFFYFNHMPVVSGNYPGVLFGRDYADAQRDVEGLQTVRSIAENMLWLIKCIKAGESIGIHTPTPEEKIITKI
ncbi:MAG: flavodoxin family protein [Clostridia bacterium]|nr:flavodoxin family protein [Clostridia bacterium]